MGRKGTGNEPRREGGFLRAPPSGMSPPRAGCSVVPVSKNTNPSIRNQIAELPTRRWAGGYVLQKCPVFGVTLSLLRKPHLFRKGIPLNPTGSVISRAIQCRNLEHIPQLVRKSTLP